MPATDEKREVSDRAGYLGGSDAPALLGISPFATPLQVFADKVGTGIPRIYDATRERLFFFGHALEEAIGRGAERFYHIPVERNASFWRAADRPFMGGHIDFLVSGEPAFLECKNTRFAGENWGKEIGLDDDASGVIPRYYLPQLDHYLHVLDYDYCYIAALIAGSDLRVYKVYRDAGREKKLLEVEDEMWGRVERDDPPWGQTYEDYCLAMQLGYIKQLKAPQARKQDTLLLDAQQEEILVSLRKTSKHANRLKKTATQLREQLVVSLHGKLGILATSHGDELGSLLTGTRTVFDKGLLEAEAPDLYKQYLRKTIFPILRHAGADDDDDDN